MNCRQVDKYFYDYCDNVLSPDQRVLVDQHLAECHNCRQAVDLALLETSILREEWDTPALPADFTARVMERIAAAPIPQSGPAAAHFKRPWPRWFMSIAAAAAVLLMVLYAPGMIKNENVINVADREQIVSESAGDKATVKRPAANTEDVLMGSKGEAVGNNNKVYLSQANQEQFDSYNTNQPSPTITPTNKPISYGAEDSTVSDNFTTKSADQNKEETVAAASAFPVQPANLPASYNIIDKVAGAGSCTYIFGTGVKEKQLSIKIAQLPLHSGQPNSRSYVRESAIENKAATTSAEQISPGTVPGLKDAVEETENVGILTKEGLKADTTAAEPAHTISYEIVHNNQTYVLTITANLSPQELAALSQSLELQSTTP
jgi:hypothetical protein